MENSSIRLGSLVKIVQIVMIHVQLGEMQTTNETNSSEIQRREAKNPLPKRCKQLYDAPLLKYCDGLYPSAIIVKYNDHTVKDNERFSIFFMEEEPNRYVTFFKGDEPHDCDTVYIMDEYRVECGSDRRVIKFSEPLMVCLNMHFEYVDDLAEYCKNKIHPFEPSAFLALFYTKYTPGSRNAGMATDKSIPLRVLHPCLCIFMLFLGLI